MQYIIDDKGNKTAAVIPITQYLSLLEDFDDLRVALARKNEETVSFDEIKEEFLDND